MRRRAAVHRCVGDPDLVVVGEAAATVVEGDPALVIPVGQRVQLWLTAEIDPGSPVHVVLRFAPDPSGSSAAVPAAVRVDGRSAALVDRGDGRAVAHIPSGASASRSDRHVVEVGPLPPDAAPAVLLEVRLLEGRGQGGSRLDELVHLEAIELSDPARTRPVDCEAILLAPSAAAAGLARRHLLGPLGASRRWDSLAGWVLEVPGATHLARAAGLDHDDERAPRLLADLLTWRRLAGRPTWVVAVHVDPLARALELAHRRLSADGGPAAVDPAAWGAATVEVLRSVVAAPHPFEVALPELLDRPGPAGDGWSVHDDDGVRVVALDVHRPEAWRHALEEGLGLAPRPSADWSAPEPWQAPVPLPRDAIALAYARDQRASRSVRWFCDEVTLEERQVAAEVRHVEPVGPPRDLAAKDVVAELAYLDAVRDVEGGIDRGPLSEKQVLVYSLEKSGSVTIVQSLGDHLAQRLGWSRASHHVLHNHRNELVLRNARAADGVLPADAAQRSLVADVLRLRQARGQGTFVAASHREPVSRAVSHLFQEVAGIVELGDPWSVAATDAPLLLRMLEQRLRVHADVESPLLELRPRFFDEHEMDHELGACVVEDGDVRFLVVTLERIEAWPRALGRLVGADEVSLVTRNVASEKSIAAAYDAFRRRVVVPAEVVDELHDGTCGAADQLRWHLDAATRERLRDAVVARWGPRPGADLVVRSDLLQG